MQEKRYKYLFTVMSDAGNRKTEVSSPCFNTNEKQDIVELANKIVKFVEKDTSNRPFSAFLAVADFKSTTVKNYKIKFDNDGVAIEKEEIKKERNLS